MKILRITPQSLSRIDDIEINTIHNTIHNIYKLVRQYRSLQTEFYDMLKLKHFMVVRELNKRDIDHNTHL